MAAGLLDNPFEDVPSSTISQEGSPKERFASLQPTLRINKDCSLTLGADGLIILDSNTKRKHRTNCYSFLSQCTSGKREIPFYNILWAEVNGNELAIDYASPVSATVVQSEILALQFDGQTSEIASQWVIGLLHNAYRQSQKRKRIKVLVNPHSGKGNAEKKYHDEVEPLMQAARCILETQVTKYSGEAEEIASVLDIERFDVIAACSGDGLPHEIFNGLGSRPDAKRALAKIAVVNIPCGSGNAMSWNLNGTNSASLATLAVIKGIPTSLDLVSITQGETRRLSFLSQSLGIVAESDLATEHLRWLGEQRFAYGIIKLIMKQALYPCDIAVKVAIDDKSAIKEHWKKEKENCQPLRDDRKYGSSLVQDKPSSSIHDNGLPALKYATVNDTLPEGWEMVPYSKLGNFYCGNMAWMATDTLFFPAALPNDGYMDLVCINGDIPRARAIKMLLAVEDGSFFDLPGVWYRKILGYRIIPKSKGDGYVSIDGERIPYQPFQAEIHNGLGTVLSKNGHLYETPGFENKS